MNAAVVWSNFRFERPATPSYRFGPVVLSWLLILINSVAYAQGDISLQVAKEFSLYSSGNCQRIDAPKFDLALKCQFRDKRAEFFLQENRNAGFPLNDESESTAEAAMRRVAIDPPELLARIKLWGGDAVRNDRKLVFNRYGFLYAKVDTPGWMNTMERRVLVRTYFRQSYGAVTLTVLSDFDRESLNQIGRGVPEEVMTMFGSLDLKHSRLPQP